MRRTLTRGITAALALVAFTPAVAHAEFGGHRAHMRQVLDLFSVSGGPFAAPAFSCTGTLVAPNLVLTAAHCLVEPRPELMINIGPHLYTCRRVMVDPDYDSAVDAHDLALVSLPHPVSGIGPERLGTYRLEMPATSYGFGEPDLSVETAAEFDPIIADTDYLVAAPLDGDSIGHGDSGGPLVQMGREVAVNEGTLPGGEQVFSYLDRWARVEIAAALHDAE